MSQRKGSGVDPGFEVVDDSGEMARAMREVMKAIRQNPPPDVKKPKYPNRAK